MKQTRINGLHKFTERMAKAHELLRKAKVEESDIKGKGDEEIKAFITVVNKQQELKVEASDALYEKIDILRTEEDKNRTWERNHNHIARAISVLMQEYGRMPTVCEIALKSKLSRQTMHKHPKANAKTSGTWKRWSSSVL